MLKVQFQNITEVRMGSPFETAKLDLQWESGQAPSWFPKISDDWGFLPLKVWSESKDKLALAQWQPSLQKGDPAFRVVMVDFKNERVLASEVLSGCCEGLEFQGELGVQVKVWEFDPQTKKGHNRVESVAAFETFKN